jgi:membrane protein
LVVRKLSSLRALSKDAYRIFSDRGARLLSASIAFYALLSVVPILVIALRLAALFVDPTSLNDTLQARLTAWVGPPGGAVVSKMVHTAQTTTGGSLTSVFGIGVLLYASTRLFSQLTRALDLLWNAEPLPKPTGYVERALAQVQKRTLAFVMVLVVGVLLTLTTLVQGGLAAARQASTMDISLGLRVLEGAISFATTVALFFLLFRVLPRTRVENSDALVGSVVTALLFTTGSLAVTAYVSYRDVSVYGAASAIVMLMLWVHYSAHAFFLGAAFTAAHAQQKTSEHETPPASR